MQGRLKDCRHFKLDSDGTKLQIKFFEDVNVIGIAEFFEKDFSQEDLNLLSEGKIEGLMSVSGSKDEINKHLEGAIAPNREKANKVVLSEFKPRSDVWIVSFQNQQDNNFLNLTTFIFNPLGHNLEEEMQVA